MQSNLAFADIQTLDDLNINGRYKSDSIFSIFNQTKTKGGENELMSIFENPLSDEKEILARQEKVTSLAGENLQFPLSNEEFDALYQLIFTYPSLSSFGIFTEVTKRAVLKMIGDNMNWEHHQKMITNSIVAVQKLKNWFQQELKKVSSLWLKGLIAEFDQLLDFSYFHENFNPTNLNYADSLKIEGIFRGKNHADFEKLIAVCHQLDCYISIANFMHDRKFVMPSILGNGKGFMFENVSHPALINGVGNSLQLANQENFMFLTGANMAGKSTIMKTIGVNVYLAHLGLPVSASKMQFSLIDGIYTSINLPDNLNKGYSHFYAEVLRVKEVAEAVASGKRLLVIFDELFKGTNVKDAFEATYEVSKAFMEYKRCFFVLSTHIVEVGEALQEANTPTIYRYMPTIMNGNIATYPYTMRQGVSEDRHGMMIIKQEGILDLFTNN